MLSIDKIKNVYLVGIGGIGVSALAKFFLKLEKNVSGSDISDSSIIKELQNRGVGIYPQHSKNNISKLVDILIYSPAVPFNNPERVRARELKIPEMSYPEFLGELSKEKKTIAISGTHGKSTTTALIGLILTTAKFEPTVIVGSQVKKFVGNFRFGKSGYFVAEACEYRGHMLNLNPWAIVLTNLEADHLDYYKDLNDIIKHFEKFVLKLPKGGLLVINADDFGCQKLLTDELIENLKNKGVKILKYRIVSDKRQTKSEKGDFDCYAQNIRTKNGRQYFELFFNKKSYGYFKLLVPGVFNIYNALAAATLALQLEVKREIILKTLAEYHGIWRRFEIVGKIKNKIVISDYAHHPTAVKNTIKATKEFYPGKKLLVVFQPHHHNRTKKLFKEFLICFNDLNKDDLLILNEIYDVKGREEDQDQNISSLDLVKGIKNLNVLYSKDLNCTKKLILKKMNDFDVILIMGAGDIDEMARGLK